MLSPKQIGTICFAIFSFVFSAPSFADPDIPSSASTADCKNNPLQTYSGTSNLQADWQPNTIALHWYNGDDELTVPSASQSCVYDGTLTPPATIPTKTGYTFKGWRVKDVPYGYTQLEWLENDGTQYIDTQTYPALTPRFEIEWSPTRTGSNYLCGARVSASVYYCQILGSATGQTINSEMTPGVEYSFSTRRTLGNWYRNESGYEYDENNGYRGKFVLNNLTTNTQETGYSEYKTYESLTTTNSQTILVFAVRPINIHPGVRIKSYKYYANYTDVNPTINLIPVKRDSDNVLGMWDTVSKTFLTNVGTGTFITGPVAQ